MRIMNALRTAHRNQLIEYETLLKTAVANRDSSKLPEIRVLNAAIDKRLSEMIQQLVMMKNNYSAEDELQALLADLRQIQRDYNGLIKETDTLETLRRIRQQEDVSIKRELYWYLIVFVFIAILFIGYLIFYGKRAATAPIANTVPSSPNLT
jgi:hypothetical protein